MDIHGFQTTGLNITDPHHADTIIGEASTSEENTSDPYTTYEHWKQLRSPYPDSPLHDYTAPQWPKRTTSLALEDELETEILFPSGQIEFLDGYQTRYGPAISGVEHSSQVYQDSLGPFIFYEDKSWPPKGSGPLSKVCPREPVLTYRDELASSPDSNPATIGPGQDPDAVGRKGSSSLLESPWPSSEEESLKPPEHVPKQCGISSQAAAETTFSLDVGLEGVTWHRHSPTPPGRNFPVYSLSPEVKPIGSAGPMDISSDKHLVEAQTEHRPSHAYPRRQGTGYVLSHCKGGLMTDSITASALVERASPSCTVGSLSSIQSCDSYTSYDDSGFACFSSSLPTHASPPLQSTVPSRRPSTSALPAAGSNVPRSLECVWDSCMNIVEPRKRRQLSATERAETRTVRANGACGRCRKSKRRCSHVLGSTRHSSKPRRLFDTTHAKDTRRSSAKKTIPALIPIRTLKGITSPVGSNSKSSRCTGRHLSKAKGKGSLSRHCRTLSPKVNDLRRSQLAMNITSASELGIEESSEPISGGGLPASRTDKPNIEASADAFFLQAEAERLQSARIEQVQGSNLNHSFTYLGNSLATSASSSPFTPMDLVPVHAWSLDPKPGPAVKIKDLDDPEIQCMEWVNFNDGFDSSL